MPYSDNYIYKVKIVSAYQESKKKRFNKIIIVINKYIINIPSLFS